MAQTTSLTETINNVMNAKDSLSKKRIKLIELGLRPYDISIVMAMYREQIAAAKAQGRKVKFVYCAGVEIECYNVSQSNVVRKAEEMGLNLEYQGYNHRDSRTVYKMVYDGSISGIDPIECVSPILDGTDAGFASLKTCCDVLNAVNAKVNKSTGLHVHLSTADMTDEWYINFFKNYQRLETAIDTFMASSRRGDNNHYAHTLRGIDFSACQTKDDVRNRMCSRYFKVNPMSWSRHKTIEIRHHQGTTDFDKISQWVRFNAALLEWSKTNVLDHDICCVEEIPFLNKAMKDFFKARVAHFATNIAA